MVKNNESYVVKRYGNSEEGLSFIRKLQERVNVFRSAGLGDSDFESQLLGPYEDNFFSRLWELNLAERLQESGFRICSQATGPDFMFSIDGKTVWVEAISPKPTGSLEEYCRPLGKDEMFRCRSVPFQEILLRITAAIKEKFIKFGRYIENGVVKRCDINVIAVDVSQLGFYGDTGISQAPTIVEAVYPVGPLTLLINKETGKVCDRYLSYRPDISKSSGEKEVKISTDNFLSGAYDIISAVIGGFGAIQRTYFTVAHNVSAKNVLPPGKVLADKEYVPKFEEDHLVLKDIRSA